MTADATSLMKILTGALMSGGEDAIKRTERKNANNSY